jgi:starch-binding outer membrane protein, SusD/RagB family
MNAMKTFNKLFVVATLIFVFGCKGDLLDTVPYGQIASGSMWNSENLADLGVNGVYNTLRYDHVGLNRWYFDQNGFTGMNRGQQTLTAGNTTSANGLFSGYWQQHYEGIHRANDAIFNLAERAPLTPEKRGRLLAEVKFLRAYFYFNLNIVFKGVPVYLEPVAAEEANRGRETEAKVWELIVSDLTDAINEPNLPNMYAKGNANIGRVTKAAAYALRGQAYMWMKDYAKAEADLRKVGELGPTLYQGDYKMLFKEANEQHPEMIFSVQNIGISGLGSNTQFFMGTRVSFGSCWNNYLPHADFVESFENADGTPFNWDDYLPGYNSMTPRQRAVFFLRDGLTPAEITTFTTRGADMSKYLPEGNEARIKLAYDNRDPRLKATVITPYSDYFGALGIIESNFTLRWPYRSDQAPTRDLRTDTNNLFYYLWRKWVYEGASETPNRAFGPIDQPLIRYADVVLMLAEAINEQRSGDAEAVNLVNSVRQRAGMPNLQNVTGQADLRERIRNERRWELAIEGINYFDELRWGTWTEKKFYDGAGARQIWGENQYSYFLAGDYITTWPIPRVEIERNSNLVQNPGWID